MTLKICKVGSFRTYGLPVRDRGDVDLSVIGDDGSRVDLRATNIPAEELRAIVEAARWGRPIEVRIEVATPEPNEYALL